MYCQSIDPGAKSALVNVFVYDMESFKSSSSVHVLVLCQEPCKANQKSMVYGRVTWRVSAVWLSSCVVPLGKSPLDYAVSLMHRESLLKPTRVPSRYERIVEEPRRRK